MYKKARKYELNDGRIVTVREVMEVTGMTQNACYFRLQRSKDPEVVFAIPREKRNGHTVYKLDDGSDWTAPELVEHLNCKKSTASARLSTMNGDAKRILAPIFRPQEDEEIFLNKQEIKKRVSERMLEDSTGFWRTLYGLK